VLQWESAGAGNEGRNGARFILYVEGPGDRSILRAWSYRLLPDLTRPAFRSAVILGGRRPARAIEHYRREREAGNVRALCVLDRDDESAARRPEDEPGIEFFTWSRRHIESYLLVPDAILRAVDGSAADGRLQRMLRDHLPAAADESALRDIDAKRLLGARGALHRALGRPLPLARIARATREPELHPDVHALFARIREAVAPATARV